MYYGVSTPKNMACTACVSSLLCFDDEHDDDDDVTHRSMVAILAAALCLQTELMTMMSIFLNHVSIMIFTKARSESKSTCFRVILYKIKYIHVFLR